MANTLEWVLGIIAVIGILMIFTGHLDLNVHLQSVVGTDCPAFKSGFTNYSNIDNWIATDCNQDGTYEAYTFAARGTGVTPGTTPRKATPEGLEYFCKNINSAWYVYVTTPTVEDPGFPAYPDGLQIRYDRCTVGPCNGADLTCSANPPCTPDCAGKCGGVSDGCGGTCNAVCSGTGCDAAGDGDGKISWSEFTSIAQRWVGGN